MFAPTQRKEFLVFRRLCETDSAPSPHPPRVLESHVPSHHGLGFSSRRCTALGRRERGDPRASQLPAARRAWGWAGSAALSPPLPFPALSPPTSLSGPGSPAGATSPSTDERGGARSRGRWGKPCPNPAAPRARPRLPAAPRAGGGSERERQARSCGPARDVTIVQLGGQGRRRRGSVRRAPVTSSDGPGSRCPGGRSSGNICNRRVVGDPERRERPRLGGPTELWRSQAGAPRNPRAAAGERPGCLGRLSGGSHSLVFHPRGANGHVVSHAHFTGGESEARRRDPVVHAWPLASLTPGSPLYPRCVVDSPLGVSPAWGPEYHSP